MFASEDFIEEFHYFIDLSVEYADIENKYKKYSEENNIELNTSYWSLKLVDIEIEDMKKTIQIVKEISKGNKNYLKEISYVKEYFEKILCFFKYRHDCRRDWRYTCPGLYPDLYDIEERLIYCSEY